MFHCTHTHNISILGCGVVHKLTRLGCEMVQVVIIKCPSAAPLVGFPANCCHVTRHSLPYLSCAAPLDVDALPTTRSGRRVYPQLAWWANQRVFLHKSEDAEVIMGTVDQLSYTPQTFTEDTVRGGQGS